MHELSITQNIVAIASAAVTDATITRVTLEIGQLSAVMADAIAFCFDVCTENTPLQGAKLEIIEIPGVGQCRHCQSQFPLDQPYGICPHCNSLELDIIQGEELKIKELEVEPLCA
jgi:hydrogenase nickel incorporation protein HypA/HybF